MRVLRSLVILVACVPAVVRAQPAGDDLDVPAATPPPTATAPAPTAPAPAPTAPPVTPAPVVSAEPAPTVVAPPVAPAPPVVAKAPAPSVRSLAAELGLEIAGYVQVQQQWDQSSQDQLAPDGSQLNQDVLAVRRGRFFIGRTWERSAIALEVDVNTVRGATVSARRAEASLFWPGADHKLPIVALTAGLTDIPFGFELVQSSRDRLFMERSLASRALFPGEPDIGARVWGGVKQFRYAVALLAGEPISDASGRNRPDPNAAKDLVARVGVDTRPAEAVTIAAGVSLVAGTGFHAGKAATKDSVQWIDYNENGVLDAGELVAVPGTAATPSQNFRRWALGGDVEVGVHLVPGWLRITAEVTVASNLDRGLFVADPVSAGSDVRELGAYVAVVQELGCHAFAGFRADYYDPNLDALDSRMGSLIPVDEAITTVSPLVGVRLPYHAHLAIQYDWIVDHLARDGTGVPTDLANDRLTARLQVEL